MCAQPSTVNPKDYIAELEARLHELSSDAPAQKMRSILHDLNNKLMALRGETYLALLDAPENSPLRTHLERIQDTVETTIALTTASREHLSKSIAAPAPKKPSTKSPLSGCVLVAEDDRMLREIITMTLQPRGVRVFSVASGKEAVDLYRNHWHDIHVAVLDLTIPELNGFETFAEMKKINPDAKALLTSGYLEEDVKNKISSSGMAGFIPKPCDLDTLVEMLRPFLPAN